MSVLLQELAIKIKSYFIFRFKKKWNLKTPLTKHL